MYVFLYVCLSVCLPAWLSVCLNVGMHVCMYSEYTHGNMCVRVCVCQYFYTGINPILTG